MKEISRRSFLKGGIAAVAAMGVTVACGPQVPPAESHPESENGKETATRCSGRIIGTGISRGKACRV